MKAASRIPSNPPCSSVSVLDPAALSPSLAAELSPLSVVVKRWVFLAALRQRAFFWLEHMARLCAPELRGSCTAMGIVSIQHPLEG